MLKCFKVVDDKGRVLIPLMLRGLCGFDKNDVVQISVCGEVILINKASVSSTNPVDIIQEEMSKQKEERDKEKAELEGILKKLFSQGASTTEILNELLKFKYSEKNGEENADEGY